MQIEISSWEGRIIIDEHGAHSDYLDNDGVVAFILDNGQLHDTIRQCWGMRAGLHMSRSIDFIAKHGMKEFQRAITSQSDQVRALTIYGGPDED